MSNTPNLENLISGYLDNQLSPSVRAEVEKLLDANPEMKVLADQLQQQSDSLAQLPKFRLDDEFADRLMANSQVTNAFEALNDDSEVALKTSSSNSSRFALSASAIAALAAMVLFALFLPVGGVAVKTEVASKDIAPVDKAAEEPELFLGNAALPSMAAKKSASKFGIALEQLERLEIEQSQVAQSKPSFKRGKAKSSSSEMGVALSDGAARPASKSPNQPNAAPFEDQEMGDVANSAPVQTMKQEAVGSIDPFADSGQFEVPAAQKLGIELEFDGQQALTAGTPDVIDSVVEVEFESTGQALFDEVQLALSRNFIDLGDSEGFDNKSNSIAQKGGGGGLGGGGGGFGDEAIFGGEARKGGGGRHGALGKSWMPQANQNELSTLAVLVNTTPQQMSVLVEDLKSQQNAKVGTYEIPQPQFFESKTANLMARESPRRNRDSKKDASRSVEKLGQVQRQVKSLPVKGLESSKRQQQYRGFAQSLQKQVAPNFGQRFRPSAGQRFVPLQQSRQGEEQKQSDQHGNADLVVDDGESMARYYLLLVRGGAGQKEAENASDESLPSKANDPSEGAPSRQR